MSEEETTGTAHPSDAAVNMISADSEGDRKESPKAEMDGCAGTSPQASPKGNAYETEPDSPLASPVQSGADGSAGGRGEDAIAGNVAEEEDARAPDDALSDVARSDEQPTGQTTDSSPDQAAGEESDGAASSGEAHREVTSCNNRSDSSESEGGGEAKSEFPAGPLPKASSKSSGRPLPPPFVDDPGKITLRFIFANRDGLTVTADCKPTDTVGEVKGVLLSMWPDELSDCTGGDRLRLICMGRGILAPDSRSLEDCQVPVFKTHATPVNVSVRPEDAPGSADSTKKQSASGGGRGSGSGGGNGAGGSSSVASTGCSCTIQ